MNPLNSVVRFGRFLCQIGFNIIMVVLLGLALVAWKYPGLARSSVYNLVRDVNSRLAYYQTQEWSALETEHFSIRYGQLDPEIAALVARTAEKAYEPVSSLLGYYLSQPIPVIIHSDRVSLNQQFGWGANQSAMGVYWAGVIRVLSPSVWIEEKELPQLEQYFAQAGPMAHEYAHLLVDYLTDGNYPRWLTEGVAQYVESRVSGLPVHGQFDYGVDELYTLEELDRGFDSLPDQDLAYWQSWALADFMVERYGFHSLQSLLHTLGQGQNLDQALRRSLGINLEQFSDLFTEHLKEIQP